MDHQVLHVLTVRIAVRDEPLPAGPKRWVPVPEAVQGPSRKGLPMSGLDIQKQVAVLSSEIAPVDDDAPIILPMIMRDHPRI
jgi:hypothetical protein